MKKLPRLLLCLSILLSTASCKKVDTAAHTEPLISYEYNNEKISYTALESNIEFVKILLYKNDTAQIHFTCNFPFSSPKTTGGLLFILYNDSLIPGQQYTPSNRSSNVDLYNSNYLDVLIPENPFAPLYRWYHGDFFFQMTIDSVIGSQAFGHFNGNLVSYNYYNGMPVDVKDSIRIKNGIFKNIPIR